MPREITDSSRNSDKASSNNTNVTTLEHDEQPAPTVDERLRRGRCRPPPPAVSKREARIRPPPFSFASAAPLPLCARCVARATSPSTDASTRRMAPPPAAPSALEDNRALAKRRNACKQARVPDKLLSRYKNKTNSMSILAIAKMFRLNRFNLKRDKCVTTCRLRSLNHLKIEIDILRCIHGDGTNMDSHVSVCTFQSSISRSL